MTRGQICEKIRAMGFELSSCNGKEYTATKEGKRYVGATPMAVYKLILKSS